MAILKSGKGARSSNAEPSRMNPDVSASVERTGRLFSARRVRASLLALVGAAAMLIVLPVPGRSECCAPPGSGAACKTDGKSCVVLEVGGMTCQNCAPRARQALAGVKGVKSATVSYEKKEAVVHLDKHGPNSAALIEALKKAGFSAQNKDKHST